MPINYDISNIDEITDIFKAKICIDYCIIHKNAELFEKLFIKYPSLSDNIDMYKLLTKIILSDLIDFLNIFDIHNIKYDIDFVKKESKIFKVKKIMEKYNL
jgi:hypothetical protein